LFDAFLHVEGGKLAPYYIFLTKNRPKLFFIQKYFAIFAADFRGFALWLLRIKGDCEKAYY